VFVVADVVADGYLSILWLTGHRPVGNRPLLALGTLLIVVGFPMLVFGLLAEMLTAVTYRRADITERIRRITGGNGRAGASRSRS
jgi:hypothetical protein